MTHRQLVLYEALLWTCRRPGADSTIASYTRLCDIAHVSRGVVAGGLRRLRQLGLVQVVKRRLRVAWGASIASRQMTSCYRFTAVATEFAATTVFEEMKILSPGSEVEQRQAQAELARIAASRIVLLVRPRR